jgi:hypothetical protein
MFESDLAWAPTHTLTNPFIEVVDHSAATSILAAGYGMARHHESPAPEVRGAVTRETTEGCRASPQCPVRRSACGHRIPI